MVGVQIIDEKIKAKVTTKNIYKIFNEFIIPLISKEERKFLIELEDFLVDEIEPKNDLSHEVYELFPILGRGNYMQRLNRYGEGKHFGMRYELLLAMATTIVEPELDLARVVSGLIFANPLFQHGENKRQKQILDDVITGKKIGCIGITERKQGSDAVNMKTTIKKEGDGLIINGEKIFTTNGPVADYFFLYGVSDTAKPRGTMYQVIAERGFEGLKTHRLGINSVPRVEIGQTILNNVKIPKENVLAWAGQGYKNLFEGLVAERDTIIGSSLGLSWLTSISALIYTNFRVQFKRPIFDFQGVSFPMTKLFTELMSATTIGLRTGSEYRKLIDYKDPKFIKYNASFSSGTKYLTSNLAHRICYEAQQMLGGIGYTDNMKVDIAVEVSKIQEIIGGSRNIQLFLVSRALKNMIKQL